MRGFTQKMGIPASKKKGWKPISNSTMEFVKREIKQTMRKLIPHNDERSKQLLRATYNYVCKKLECSTEAPPGSIDYMNNLEHLMDHRDKEMEEMEKSVEELEHDIAMVECYIERQRKEIKQLEAETMEYDPWYFLRELMSTPPASDEEDGDRNLSSDDEKFVEKLYIPSIPLE